MLVTIGNANILSRMENLFCIELQRISTETSSQWWNFVSCGKIAMKRWDGKIESKWKSTGNKTRLNKVGLWIFTNLACNFSPISFRLSVTYMEFLLSSLFDSNESWVPFSSRINDNRITFHFSTTSIVSKTRDKTTRIRTRSIRVLLFDDLRRNVIWAMKKKLNLIWKVWIFFFSLKDEIAMKKNQFYHILGI